MPQPNFPESAHHSFPLSAPALQSVSLKPDFKYPDINHARKLNALLDRSGPHFKSSELAAIGLLGKVYLTIIRQYLGETSNLFTSLDAYLEKEVDQERVRHSLSDALTSFPTPLTFKDAEAKSNYYLDFSGSPMTRHSYYFSIILIMVAENNPAIRSVDGLFTDPQLRASKPFSKLAETLQAFFATQPDKVPSGSTLLDLLFEPGYRHPDSLFDQLIYVSQRWKDLLDPDLLRSVIIGLDYLKEFVFPRLPGSKVPQNPLGHLQNSNVPSDDPVRFSSDNDWMPNVILQAKNVYVWLDQLSQEYRKPIKKLDQIPEEELKKLSDRGLNALWLIGLWERSPASQTIKQICGNPEAAPSAYSLFDYSIAESLGGEAALQQLSLTAANFEIKLAADMVPNHMGVDSRWVIEHPDWFLSLESPPFPGYTYQGVDLSSDPSVSIFIEDHYYDKSDAAVVFKRQDNLTGEIRYIYHGNDGTSTPWNDTAQLDYLNPEVRESVTQTILQVAKSFPIIRFDAAMTLSKKHYHRLWFPEQGSGGAIPTRTDFSLSKDQFDKEMPDEFWRDLVDRISDEVPDTLLLAEAFWMMEGYFVRSLGLHRVYNSAFMHMLRNEDNKKYRALLIDTLEFDPQILKRYVNFMNNPDEDTALSQFGSGGKYFGTCLVMSTLPGLPMFGHGQIEGFAEKYGMEYKKAYYNEIVDPEFIERHQNEIAPLLFKRRLFSNVEHFILYDFVKEDGSTNEDVFAYSNRNGDEIAMVIFHNKWGDTQGSITHSVSLKGQSIDLLAGLGLTSNTAGYLLFKDQITHLEYVHKIEDLADHGLHLKLGAYQYHAFINFRVVIDQDGSYSALHQALEGVGSYDLDRTRLELKLDPIVDPIKSLLSAWELELPPQEKQEPKTVLDIQSRLSAASSTHGRDLYQHLATLFPERKIDWEIPYKTFQDKMTCILSMLPSPFPSGLAPDHFLLISWACVSELLPYLSEDEMDSILGLVTQAISAISKSNAEIQDRYHYLLSASISLYPSLPSSSFDMIAVAELWFSDPHSIQLIDLHDYGGQNWFHKESMELLINLSCNLQYLKICRQKNAGSFLEVGMALEEIYQNVLKIVSLSECRTEKFLGLLPGTSAGDGP